MIKVMEVKKVNILKKTSGITVSFLVGSMCAIGFLEVLQKDEETIYNNNINFSYNKAVSKASPAVVNIFSERLVNSSLNKPRRNIDSIFSKKRNQIKTSLGSGVLFSSDGYILTNQHVIGENIVNVIVELSDGRKINAKIVGIDKELVGKVASEIKKLKPIEPYKAKGIKERGQFVLRKEGKKK